MPTTDVALINYEQVPLLPSGQTPAPTWPLLMRNPDTNEVWECELSRLLPAIVPAEAPNANSLPNVSLALDKKTLIIGGTVTLAATATDSDGTIAKVEFFDVTTPIGTVVGSGPYAIAYTPSTVGSHSLTAKATDNKGGSRTTAPIDLPVQAVPNAIPTVSLTLSAATVQQGQPITLIASATDSDGTIAKVEFYDGSQKVGQVTQAPYSLAYTPGLTGQRAMYVVATDNSGGVGTSDSKLLVVVSNAANKAPTVSLSINAPNPVVGQPVLLSATASDSDGTVAKVEFFNSGSKIGEATQTPYSLSYTPDHSGTYFFVAKATDNGGVSAETASSFLLVGSATATAAVPDAPTGVSGSAGDATVLVSWQAPLNSGSSRVTSYNVYRAGASTPFANTAGTSVTDTTVTNGTAYSYEVVAVNTAGSSVRSVPSQPVTPKAAVVAPTNTVPDAPTIGTATAGDHTVSIAFTAPAKNGGLAITQYAVYRNGDSAPLGTTTGSPYTDNTALNGTAYTYTVAAVNSIGTGPKSASSNQVTPVAPVVAPPAVAPLSSYSVLLTGPSATEPSGVTLTSLDSGQQVGFNRKAIVDTTGKHMDISVAGGQVIALDFPASYLGDTFSFAHAGGLHQTTFQDTSTGSPISF